jgi:hypothetical protein
MGYEIVRKPSWYGYDPGVTRGTKELVATATWCASAWLSVRLQRCPYGKHERVRVYRDARAGAQGELVVGLWHLCRERLHYQLPVRARDIAELRDLCVKFLDLESEIVRLGPP